MFGHLSDEQRRTLVLLEYYEKTRRESGQFGYRALPCSLEDITADHFKSPLVKQFDTLRRWLEERGWNIGESHLTWMGYVRYAFVAFAPTVPMPGQLCNAVLLKRYLGSFATNAPKRRTPQQLEDIYKRVVRKDIADNIGLMTRLGLAKIEQRTNNS
jgi:hypothetical protein